MAREEHAVFEVEVSADEYVMSEVRSQIEDISSEYADVEVIGLVEE